MTFGRAADKRESRNEIMGRGPGWETTRSLFIELPSIREGKESWKEKTWVVAKVEGEEAFRFFLMICVSSIITQLVNSTLFSSATIRLFYLDSI